MDRTKFLLRAATGAAALFFGVDALSARKPKRVEVVLLSGDGGPGSVLGAVVTYPGKPS